MVLQGCSLGSHHTDKVCLLRVLLCMLLCWCGSGSFDWSLEGMLEMNQWLVLKNRVGEFWLSGIQTQLGFKWPGLPMPLIIILPKMLL